MRARVCPYGNGAKFHTHAHTHSRAHTHASVSLDEGGVAGDASSTAKPSAPTCFPCLRRKNGHAHAINEYEDDEAILPQDSG